MSEFKFDREKCRKAQLAIWHLAWPTESDHIGGDLWTVLDKADTQLRLLTHLPSGLMLRESMPTYREAAQALRDAFSWDAHDLGHDFWVDVAMELDGRAREEESATASSAKVPYKFQVGDTVKLMSEVNDHAGYHTGAIIAIDGHRAVVDCGPELGKFHCKLRQLILLIRSAAPVPVAATESSTDTLEDSVGPVVADPLPPIERESRPERGLWLAMDYGRRYRKVRACEPGLLPKGTTVHPLPLFKVEAPSKLFGTVLVHRAVNFLVAPLPGAFGR